MSETARDAVDRLMREHGGRLHGLARRFCGDESDAEDLVQEVLLQALRDWDGFEGRSKETTWLYTIAARTCARMQKKGRRDAGERADAARLPFDAERIAAVPDDLDPALERQVREEARTAVEAAIAELPEEFRVPLVLKEIVGLEVADVAAILGLPEGTVRSRLHRARLRLRGAVDRVLPRAPGTAPPPAYPERVCLDLLEAKQQALDRGVPFEGGDLCARCRSVFASLDLARDACLQLGDGELPPELLERLRNALDAAGAG